MVGLDMLNLKLNADGSCGPTNPEGLASYAFLLSDLETGKAIQTGADKLGNGLGNNYAEFYGLYEGLKCVSIFYDKSEDKAIQLFVKMDSALVINVVKKKWKTSPDKLYYPAALFVFEELRKLRAKGVIIFCDWIPREENSQVDAMSKYQNFQ